MLFFFMFLVPSIYKGCLCIKSFFQFEAGFVILNVNLFGFIQCLCYNQSNLVVGDLLLSTKSNGTTTRVEGTF